MTSAVKVYLPDDLAEIIQSTAKAEEVGVSSLLVRLIAGQVAMAGSNAKTDSIAPAVFEVSEAVRFNVTLPKNILDILDARAERQGHSRSRYIASVLTSHASIEPVYDREQQATIARVSDKVHALAVSINMMRSSMERSGKIPTDLDATLLTITDVCGKLLMQLNQMRLSNVERWRIR